MIIVEYDPVNGALISDAECLELPKSLKNKDNIHLKYSNELILHAVIEVMLDNVISNDNLIIRFNKKDYSVDDLGYVVSNLKFPREILKERMSKKRLAKLGY